MDDADPDPNFNLTNYIDNPNPNPVIYVRSPLLLFSPPNPLKICVV